MSNAVSSQQYEENIKAFKKALVEDSQLRYLYYRKRAIKNHITKCPLTSKTYLKKIDELINYRTQQLKDSFFY